jgi:hypothetical protein
VIPRQITVLDHNGIGSSGTATAEFGLDRQGADDYVTFEVYVGIEPAVANAIACCLPSTWSLSRILLTWRPTMNLRHGYKFV